MLPLLSTSLLDTLKILMIGNMLTYDNQMPGTLQDIFISDGRRILIDSLFFPNENAECIILKTLYPETPDCTAGFIKSHKAWKKESPEYADFVGLIKDYDVIYLQSNEIDDLLLYEVIESIDQVIDKDAVIILFQNYSTNTSNENARRKELNQQLQYFQRYNKSEKVILLEIGDLFDKLMMGESNVLIDDSGSPTKAGSDIIASMLYEIVRPYVY